MVVEAGRSAAASERKKTSISSISGGAAMKKRLSNKKQAEEGGRTKKQSSHCTEPAAESPAGSCRLAVMRSLFSCRNNNSSSPADSRSNKNGCKLKDSRVPSEETACKRRVSSVSTLSDLPASSNSKQLLQRGGSSSSSGGGSSSFRAGMQLRRLSGCYECHMALDPVAGSSSSMRVCPDCGEIFVRQESLQLHQTIKHAVSELGAEDTSRNIIEIIFQSSWLKKQSPVCRIERILKVHNTARTLGHFEEYREAVKARKGSSRCSADGNELLRFHCAPLACQLGLNGATHLCLLNACAACAIIRHGFTATTGAGVLTTATSGRAHDACSSSSSSRWAMLVCRVIAGRVKKRLLQGDDDEEFDSVGGSAGVYSNMEELQVFNPTAILPCFVVVYKA